MNFLKFMLTVCKKDLRLEEVGEWLGQVGNWKLEWRRTWFEWEKSLVEVFYNII